MKNIILFLIGFTISPNLSSQNNALDFDGLNDFVNCGDPASNIFDLTGSTFTLESWINLNSFHAGGINTILSKDEGGGSQDKWIFSYNTNHGGVINKFAFHVNTGASIIWVTPPNSCDLSLNTWTHIAVVKDGTQYTFYKDGISCGATTNTITIPDVNEDLHIGNAEGSFFSDGQIDEVRIWNTARTQSEIQNNMNIELSGSETGLDAYYKFNQGIAGGDNGSGCPPPGVPCVNTLEDETSNNNDGSLTNFALSGSFSNWVSDSPLPVEIISFEGDVERGEVLLVWETVSEIDNKGYQIERSNHGKDWERIGFVDGQGTTLGVQKYYYTDEHPYTGISYYRLKQIDFDDVFEYSKVISVSVDWKGEIEIYPNPTNGNIHIIGIEEGNMTILDCLGRRAKIGTINNPNVDLSNLPSGVYFLIIKSNNQLIKKKIMKK